MQLSVSTSTLLDALVSFSGGKLTRRDDLGALIELSARQDRIAVLEDLCFLAKFLSKTYGIINRIDQNGDAFDRLSREFSYNLQKASSLVQTLVSDAPKEVQERFARTYLSLEAGTLRDFLALCYDLSWYKNWLIDHP
jgi:hypothetical protein